MLFTNFYSKQARKPSGLFGRIFMSQVFDKGNALLNKFVKETLGINSSDNLLEIGCGTGSLVSNIAKELKNGSIEGVDFSKTMISIANRRNKKNMLSNKVNFHLCDFIKVDFGDKKFDKIFTVNTVYF